MAGQFSLPAFCPADTLVTMADSLSPVSIAIDEASRLPVYQQIAEQLRVEIERGDRAPGERLPAIRRLAADLSLHRDTVALAYEHLAESGWVEARVGAGTFVRSTVASWAEVSGRSGSDAALAPGTGRRPGGQAESSAALGAAREIDLALAPQVERLISLENTRPQYETGDDVVAMHRLVPDPRFYPIDEFRECVDAAIREEGPELFSYAAPQGDPELRRAMATRFKLFGIRYAPEEHVLCHGASQGISLALRLFTQPGDQVAVEVPTYANVLSALAGLGLSAAPVPMEEDGPDPDALDRMLAKPEVKAFYTIPSFHNPLGTTASLERRRLTLEIAERHGVPIIEDGFEMDLRFRGPEMPPLAALDEAGIVVLLFSFSKSLFPGVRVGSLSARGRALEGLVALKHATDLSDALPLQAGLARFVESGAYDRHLARIRKILRARHRALDEALATSMPEGTTWTSPDGGYQRWVELPDRIDTRALLPEAARAGVLYSPGTLFMPDARPTSAMRLTVSGADETEIKRGVAVLAEVASASRSVRMEKGRTGGMHL
jgi:DNA-binding transcriptional MocR family regulator